MYDDSPHHGGDVRQADAASLPPCTLVIKAEPAPCLHGPDGTSAGQRIPKIGT